MTSSKNLRGVLPPAVTIFDEAEKISESGMQDQVRFLMQSGVHGITVGGSTGEGHTLSSQELSDIVKITLEVTDSKVPLIAGIIENSTKSVIKKIDALKNLPINALQITPVYYLFEPDQASIIEYYRDISKSTDKPIIIYNVIPWVYLSVETLLKVMDEVPQVIGVKQSAGDLESLALLLKKRPPGKLVITAVDPLLCSSFCLGADGVIAALPTAAPSACVALWNACQQNNFSYANSLHEKLLGVWDTIKGPNLPANVKYCLELQGCNSGIPRRPMQKTTDAQKSSIEKAFSELNRFSQS